MNSVEIVNELKKMVIELEDKQDNDPAGLEPDDYHYFVSEVNHMVFELYHGEGSETN